MRGTWEGTTAELLTVIEQRTEEQKKARLPSTERGLMAVLRRLGPDLRKKLVDVRLPTKQEGGGKRRGQRLIRIRWKPEEATLSEEATLFNTDERVDLLNTDDYSGVH